ncbi:hypothetical protein T10_9572 [Trichinella papuae]|uniref:Uncharacterized protein n=1 Tax=Trichinella papuae TaxID=268474 RepID=A0A0V1MIJ0_9BILA|nr:hypothetical protein T10_9572 [Trichinella papuae]
MKERISCFLVNNENFVNVEKKFDKMAGRVLLSAKSCVAIATQPTRTVEMKKQHYSTDIFGTADEHENAQNNSSHCCGHSSNFSRINGEIPTEGTCTLNGGHGPTVAVFSTFSKHLSTKTATIWNIEPEYFFLMEPNAVFMRQSKLTYGSIL